MPIHLNSVEQLRDYLRGVINRAGNHAPEVEEVVFTLAGAIVLYKDAGAALEAYSRSGRAANVLWTRINRQRYAFSYDHDNGQIVIKRGGTQGNIIGSFDNSSTPRTVIRLFRRLSSSSH